MKKFIYTEINPQPSDLNVDGVVLLDDNVTFSDIKGTRVLVFDNTKKAKLALERVKETYEINHGFLAALDGHAEELSIDTLVKFYLANGM